MAVPTDKTFARGTRDTADNITHEKPYEVSNKIWMTKPAKNRALGYMLADSQKESSTRRTFWHLENAPNKVIVEYNGDDEAAQAATGLVFTSATGVHITEGSRVYFPRTEQIIRLTAEMASSTTSGSVARNFGLGSSTDYLKKGDKGVILPPAMYEGFTMGKGLASTLVQKSFNMTELSYPVQVTFVEQGEAHRGGKPFQRDLKARLVEAKDKMEFEMFFGYHVDDTTTYTHPIGAATGLQNYVSTHVFSISRMSRMDFFDLMTLWKMWNPEGGVIFGSTAFCSMITQWQISSTTVTMGVEGQSGRGQIGLDVDRVKWLKGTWDVVEADCLNYTEELMGKAFFVPKGHFKYRFLQGEDIRYRPVERDEVHAREGEIYGLWGAEWFEEELFMRIDGLEF